MPASYHIAERLPSSDLFPFLLTSFLFPYPKQRALESLSRIYLSYIRLVKYIFPFCRLYVVAVWVDSSRRDRTLGWVRRVFAV